MTNPFRQTSSAAARQQQQRRERFKVSVYAALGGLAFLLVILLIQGCHAGRAQHSGAVGRQAAVGTSGARL